MENKKEEAWYAPMFTFLRRTMNFQYIKDLIADSDNDNLKEFIGTILSGVLGYCVIYSLFEANNASERLNIIIYLMMFIGGLFGIDGLFKSFNKSSDNRVMREVEVAKCVVPTKNIESKEKEVEVG